MKLWVKILFAGFYFCNVLVAQTTIINYDFNAGAAYPLACPSTAAGVTGSATSTEPWAVFGGTTTGGTAFTANGTAGNALSMGNSSGTNTRYFQFQLGGANLNTYCCYKIYLQSQRSGTGATTITLQYSTDGVSYTSFGTTGSPGNGSFNEIAFDLCSITALNNQPNVYFRLYASGASGVGTLRIDNFEVQASTGCVATTITTGAVSASSFTVDCTSGSAGTVDFTSTGTFNAGNVYTAQLSDASGSFASPANIGTLSSTANSGTINITIPANTVSGAVYQIQIVSNNPSVTGSSSATFTITLSCYCPTLTGAILNSCNNPSCNEGDSEILLFNSGTYSVNVASFPAHTVDYYGNAANFSAGTVNAYAGTASSNAGITTALNSSTGCSGSFIDANTAGTIPAGATFIMVPNNFCYSNYDFSNICASFSPIYVVYFSTVGWNNSGNLANYQVGSNPKYITADFSWVSGTCTKQYYTYDAGSEYSGGTGGGDGASIAFPQSVSTTSATPTDPNYYSAAGACTLPTVLPINLIEFKAETLDATTSRVKFETSEEKNVKQYIISKSFDGRIFSVFDYQVSLNKQVKTDYFSYDKINQETNQIIYYRLEEEDFNGAKKIVGNCLVNLKPAKEIFVTLNESGLVISSPLPLKAIEFLSLDGKNIISAEGNEEERLFEINLEGIPGGFYLLKVTDVNEKVTVKKIIR